MIIFREARVTDIPQMQVVRNSVKENILSNPALVSDEDCKNYLLNRGQGWVCEIDDRIVGFAIVDLREHNVWALFVEPGFEGMGIGRRLHNDMLDWHFSHSDTTIWLGCTADKSRKILSSGRVERSRRSWEI